jgi:hypothetical protein
LLVVAACARAGSGVDGVDATPPADASLDATPCAIQTYYKDADGDGHGNAAMPVQACTAPAGTVASKDDCDDGNAQRHPAHPEICDAIDNDCNGITSEVCPTGCVVMRRPPPDDLAHAYLFCNITTSWTNARATCSGAMHKMVQIENAAENAYVRSAANMVFPVGVNLHIGGTDGVTEGTWVWDGSDPFWQGTQAGTPIGGRFASWDPDEPNNSGGSEDCSEMKIDGTWNDLSCGTALRFVCRR